jgi:predicted secreted hydrolase
MKRLYWVPLIIFVAFLLFWGLSRGVTAEPTTPAARLLGTSEVLDGFRRADRLQALTFPADFGPHPDYQTEWWYYTGNLESEAGRRFGYQLTFFRRALVPAGERAERASLLATDQVYMAHFALSDIAAGEHYAFERFTRGAAGLAGAQADPYQVWLENWEVTQTGESQYRLTAGQEDILIDLNLEDLKGPILHGEGGYSQKGPEAGNASYYYSQTRLRTTGFIQIPGESYRVSGLSWKDHEYSTSALSPGQVGWDWFSIQLDDGSELMVFQIRRADGSIDPFSSGTLVAPNGGVQALNRDEFTIQVADTWPSPNTGATYPARWTVSVPAMEITLNIEPYLRDQEMNVSYAYWEGAVGVTGVSGGQPVTGSGYVEMTGYAASMEGEF